MNAKQAREFAIEKEAGYREYLFLRLQMMVAQCASDGGSQVLYEDKGVFWRKEDLWAVRSRLRKEGFRVGVTSAFLPDGGGSFKFTISW